MEERVAFLTGFFGRTKMSVFLQNEKAECGLACLVVVANYWGYKLDLPRARQLFKISTKGLTLRSLIQISELMNLDARAIRIDLDSVRTLATPCILHWDMNHFVVLERCLSDYAVVIDPAIGRRRVSYAELASHFTGVVLELSPSPTFVKRDERIKYAIGALLGKIVGIKSKVAKLILLGLAMQLLALVAPFYMQWLLDYAVANGDYDLINVLGIGFLLLVAIQACIVGVRSWLSVAFSASLNYQWLGNIFGHLLKLPISYFEQRHTGDVISRLGSVTVVQRAITNQGVDTIIDGILVSSTLFLMWRYESTLAVIAVAGTVAYAISRFLMYKALQPVASENIMFAAAQQSHVLESIRGIQSIQLLCGAAGRKAAWRNKLVDQFNSEIRSAKISVWFQMGNMMLTGGERVIIIWLAGMAVMDHQITIGMLFAFLSYKEQFTQRFNSLSDKVFEFAMLRVHCDRIADIALTEAEASTTVAAPTLPNRSDIKLQNVSYRYSDTEKLILNNLSVEVHEGDYVAITGASGCGKTTLIKVLLGLLKPMSGYVSVGGIELGKLGIDNLRSITGTVMQEDTLFAGTIFENICFFDVSGDARDVESAARAAAIHDEILAMPMGYQTLVGDIGSGLSGGQKQRLMLARALYRKPRILILDEATSHLDVSNERLVNEAIGRLHITRIVIAHRPETIAMAERVISLEEGRLAESNNTLSARTTNTSQL